MSSRNEEIPFLGFLVFNNNKKTHQVNRVYELVLR
jgi:hypothetical protein